MSDKCKICGTQFDQGLHLDCGGDCLLCMAEAGDPDCAVSVVPMLRQRVKELEEQNNAMKVSEGTAWHHNDKLEAELTALKEKNNEQ